MFNQHPFHTQRSWLLPCLIAAWLPLAAFGRVVDNFDTAGRADWQDFNFPIGVPYSQIVEESGRLRFTLAPAGQSIFSGSIKLGQTYVVRTNRTVEFRVDMIDGYLGDSFTVLFFLPDGAELSQLQGYGFAKSSTDILVSKGLNKYFVDDTTPVKNTNITLVMKLTGEGTSVVINCKVLDKDAQGAVIWERTFVDTAAADLLVGQAADSPPAPYTGGGSFGLLCFEDNGKNQDKYEVILDNAEAFVLDYALVDDFNAATRTGWQDFAFPIGVPYSQIVQESGTLRFTLAAIGTTIFSATTRSQPIVEVKEGERIELRTDLVRGNGNESIGVLYFQPEGASISELRGYGFAKSDDEVLISKGLNKYFVDDDNITIKTTNMTMVMSLEARSGSVVLNCRLLDKDAQNAVIWERTVVDTPAADVLVGGAADEPPAPFITRGNYGLACFEYNGNTQPSYEVVFDNAAVWITPQAGNTPPSIQNITPVDTANFLPASTQVRFDTTDDKTLPNDKIAIVLNGTRYTTTNGLSVTGTGSSRTVSLGNLQADKNYVASLEVTDSEGLTTAKALYFDTFLTGRFMVEIEDYNYEAGQFINNPVPMAEGTGPWFEGYSWQIGTPGIDYSDTRATPNNTDTKWRPQDPIRMQHTIDLLRDKYMSGGGPIVGTYDYDVGDIAANEWMNYTRTFTNGTYEIYLRQALANMVTGESLLQQVTSDRTQSNQTVRTLGTFLGNLSGFQYRNSALTDGLGLNKIVVRLNGTNTLRLHQVTPTPGGAGRFQNYLLFLPVADPGALRPVVISASPAPGSTVTGVRPALQAVIQNRDTSVNTNSIELKLNGQNVSPVITGFSDGARVDYTLTSLLPPGATNTAQLIFADSAAVKVTNTWSFIVTYIALDPATRRPGAGQQRGFNFRIVQAVAGTSMANSDSLERAETQLSASSPYPEYVDTNVVVQLLNQSDATPPATFGYFTGDLAFPGLNAAENGLDYFSVEVTTFLDLAAGSYRFGTRSDDGFKLQSVAQFSEVTTTPIAFRDSDPADLLYEVLVTEPGLYPMRLVLYEQGGDAHLEWYLQDMNTGVRTLINDSTSVLKAYATVAAQPQFNKPVLTGTQMTLSWTGTGTLQEITAIGGTWQASPSQANPQTVNAGSGTKFYRIRSP